MTNGPAARKRDGGMMAIIKNIVGIVIALPVIPYVMVRNAIRHWRAREDDERQDQQGVEGRDVSAPGEHRVAAEHSQAASSACT